MKRLVSTLDLSHDDWLKYRKKGIGGSDAGAICGLNPYVSPIHVYHDKISDDLTDFDNEAMRQGRDLEDYVASRFMEATGLKVRRSNAMYYHEEHPFMLANVDRMVVGEEAGLECKTASAYNADKWKEDGVPAHYLIQCYHYMAVTGAKYWYLAVVILGREFKYVKIERDESAIQDLITIESDFWNHHVLAKEMPNPDGSDICDEIINQYFSTARKDSMIQLQGFDEKLKRREDIAFLLKKLEQEAKQIEQEIKLYMSNAEYAASDKYQVSWTNVETTRIDSKRLKSENPEVFMKFSKITQSRRFMIKAA